MTSDGGNVYVEVRRGVPLRGALAIDAAPSSRMQQQCIANRWTRRSAPEPK
jgi:hypothetical protein